MAQTLREFLDSRPNLRYIFTGGKGGVGKTVTAACLAYQFAQEGKKTLVASLNPVHSLTSVFGQNLSGGAFRPVEGVPNLWAVEVDASDVVARYRDNIAVRVREFLKYADIPVDSKPFVDIAVTNPAFEESAMFDKMIDIMLNEARDFDRIVFDTAAVANAIRLIGLSKIYGLWLNRMIQSRKEALSLRVQLSFRKEKVEEEVRKDPMLADLLDMNDRFTRVKKLLVDPEVTAFFFVTLPLTLPISVVKRFIEQVRAYDIPVGGVLVNSCIRADEARRAAGDEYLQNKFREQMGYMQVIEQDLGPLVRSYIPLYKSEVHGLDALKQVARDMFAPADAALYIA
ncbi:arsenite-transporting ATPase [Symbiobacterium terraclitae]|uniref:Arsenite-transporting ATPase n=1 Tax=Symbiobacterium terraclitae TaxID=557451 RepID=A0ABS4JTG2_9FIRM|nr:ArsA family ATPase [Symbiobacterium terraclitae]MBP2018818.1 arsenite-transporting ATPase [Symbiobacterium terraclitae]